MFERLGVLPPLSFCAMSEATLAGRGCRPSLDVARDRRARKARDDRRHAQCDGLGAPRAARRRDLHDDAGRRERRNLHGDHASDARHRTERLRAHDPRNRRSFRDRLAPHGAAVGEHHRTLRCSAFTIAANVESLRKSFAALGIEINAVLPLGATPDDLRTIGRAWVNVPTAHELAKPTLEFLRERFGTPYVDELPYGEAGTTRFLRELCGALRDSAGADRDRRPRCEAPLVFAHGRRTRTLLRNASACSACRPPRPGSHACLRDELDMEVEFVGTYALDYGDWLRERVRDITDNVLVTDDYRAVAREIDRTRPDIVFGSQMERHSASGFGRTVRGRLAAVPHPQLPARIRAVHRIRRREPHRRPRQPDAGTRARAPPDRDVRSAGTRAVLPRPRRNPKRRPPSRACRLRPVRSLRKSRAGIPPPNDCSGASRFSCARKRARTSRSTRASGRSP